MKSFRGLSLLSMAFALAGVVHGEKAMADKANLVAMPDMANMQQAVALTEKGPRGGWKAHGGHFGHKASGGGGGGSGSASKCGAHETKCGDFCADLETNNDFCGACDNECPWKGYCDEGVCVCPEDLHCQLGDTCVDSLTTNEACGASCDASHFPTVCSEGHCLCPETGNPDFCEYENGIVGHCTNYDNSDQDCGKCNYACPQYDAELEYGGSYCQGGQCVCHGTNTICGATDTFGGYCVDTLTNENFCGANCAEAITCREGSTCINGKCSKPCTGLTCVQSSGNGPALCQGAPNAGTCYCGISANGPTFCLANFGPEVCTQDAACNADTDCAVGSICYTNTCNLLCHYNGALGVCRPVDDGCNSYYP